MKIVRKGGGTHYYFKTLMMLLVLISLVRPALASQINLACTFSEGKTEKFTDKMDDGDLGIRKTEASEGWGTVLLSITQDFCTLEMLDIGHSIKLPVLTYKDSRVVCGEEEIIKNKRLENGVLIKSDITKRAFTINRYDGTLHNWYRNNTVSSLRSGEGDFKTEMIMNDYYSCRVSKKLF